MAGDELSYYSRARSDLVSLVAGRGLTILELGCATGTVARELIERGTALAVDGVEFNAAAAMLAAEHVRAVHHADLDTFDFDLLDTEYDALLAFDVLEHLVDPWGVLRRALGKVRSGGQVVASLPNVRYFRVLTSLVLRGEFTYEPEGVLDRTHLRFFTRKSTVELFEGAGLREVAVVPANRGGRAPKRLALKVARDFGQAQLYVTARKP